MAKDKKRKKTDDGMRTLQSVGFRILIPIFLALLALLICLIAGLVESRTLASQYADETAELYVNRINSDIAQMNKELILILENDPDIQSLPEQMDSTQTMYYDVLKKIKNQNLHLKIRYGEVDGFYVYTGPADVLIGDGGSAFHNSMTVGIMQEVRNFCRDMAKEPSKEVKWDFLRTDEENYIIGWYAKNSQVMCCVMEMETIFSSLQKMPRGYQVIPYMKKKDGSLILSERFEQADLTWIQKSRHSELYEYQLGTLGKICIYVVPDGGILSSLLQMQAILVLLIIMLLFLTALWVLRYYRGLLKPILLFVQSIDEMGEEKLFDANGKSNIMELEKVSQRFRGLLQKIQSLKIAIYEKELNEQKAELEYMQEQIRPHFILNCLSLIHGIADARGEKKITYMIKELSEYIRYNYRDSGTQRNLREELAHVKTYVELQRLRYGDKVFRFEVIEDGVEGDCFIPPLIIQTLVENAFVHAVNLDSMVKISLYVTSENYTDGKYLYISVSDTGSGFTKEILEALEEGRTIEYEGRRHVGMQNIKRRLQLLYGGRASMTAQNMDENYGAVVEVRIPQEADECGEKAE